MIATMLKVYLVCLLWPTSGFLCVTMLINRPVGAWWFHKDIGLTIWWYTMAVITILVPILLITKTITF